MKYMKDILEKVYENKELRKTIVPLFIGNPGLGKTKIIERFAKEKNVNLVEFITSQRNPFEISGMGMPDRDTKKMSYWDFDTLLDMKDGDILFFDELLNGNPVVLNACLTLLEQRKMISGKALPDIMIIAAANPQGMSPLTPQVKERFIWYDVRFDKTMWIEYMIDKYQITDTIGDKLSSLILKEDFKENNFYTPRSLDKAVHMLINEVLTPYSDVVLPILSELIRNENENTIEFPKWGKIEPNESVMWIDLIKRKIKNKNEITNK